MNLKGIVEKLVSDQAVEYFDGLCREHGVKVYGRTVSSVELEKGKNEYTFTVTINIFDDHSGWYAETPSTYVEIGGLWMILSGVLCPVSIGEQNISGLQRSQGGKLLESLSLLFEKEVGCYVET